MLNDYKVYGAYFSPTGGTKKAVTMLANQFSDLYELVNLTDKKERINKIVFSKNDLLIAAAPVYAGQIPIVERLFENLEGKNTPCIVMATYGNRHYDDALAQLKDILEKRGFICIGAIASIIPHIYSKKLGVNRPDNEDEIIMKSFTKKIINKLKEDKLESVEVPGNREPKKLEIKPGSKIPKNINKKLCNSCGVCINECPVNAIDNISMEVDAEKCISCMKCAFVCKLNARSFDCEDVREYLEGNYMERRAVELFI